MKTDCSLILAVSFGFAFFDRNAVSYLSTYIVDDLKINNTQVGMLGAALSLSWALSAVVVSRWSDELGSRKAISGCYSADLFRVLDPLGFGDLLFACCSRRGSSWGSQKAR